MIALPNGILQSIIFRQILDNIYLRIHTVEKSHINGNFHGKMVIIAIQRQTKTYQMQISTVIEHDICFALQYVNQQFINERSKYYYGPFQLDEINQKLNHLLLLT